MLRGHAAGRSGGDREGLRAARADGAEPLPPLGQLEERSQRGIEQLPETLGEAIDIAADSELVLRTLGEHTFRRFVEIKRQEWDDYRVQVTPYEIENFLPVL